MCVAIIGKVIEVHERTATVELKGSRLNATSGILPVSVGDNVLVHAGCILQIVLHIMLYRERYNIIWRIFV